MTVPLDVAVSLDGTIGVAVEEVDPVVGRLRITERGLGGSVRISPDAPAAVRIRVLIDAIWYMTDNAPSRNEPRLNVEASLPAFFTFVLGEALDDHGLPVLGQDTILDSSTAVLGAFGRPPAKTAAIERYAAARIKWAYEFGLSPVSFGLADQRRLGVPLSRINEVASACAGEAWTVLDSSPPRFRLAKRSRPIADPASLLNVARIPWRATDEVPRRGMDKAMDLLAASDLENAVKEAVASLETVALRTAGLSKGTLGDAIRALRQAEVLPKPMDRSLEAIWGFASNQRGVRHGSGDGALDPATASYVIDSAAAAIAFLLGRPRDAV